MARAESVEGNGGNFAAEKTASLLDVDAGAEHGNETPRQARGYYGHRYGGYGGYYGGRRHYGGYGRRGYGRYYVIAVIVCLNLAQAESVEENGGNLVADEAAALFDVDAGAEHGNESPREARGYYGHRHHGYGGYYGGRRHYGGYGGYGHRGYGRYYG
ncbi:unnamed protein product [Ceratitis capitata]|uniref:(Mediterranean fruit fly) hypothetical protein n=1 Tax=Ceratitis capitata TaxID=7213 RepID=A0A811U2I0_CERCA|nr:unnamed protein product [Ceratitis capitata]